MRARKVVVLGDFSVGKTSLIRRYVLNEFSESYRATLGVHPYKFTDTVDVNGAPTEISLILWDMEGAAMPQPMTVRNIRGSAGAIIVGDATRPDAAETVTRYARLVEETTPGRPIVIAYNKSDLLADAGAAETLELPALARRFDAPGLLTSALSGNGVVDLFRTLSVRIIQLGM